MSRLVAIPIVVYSDNVIPRRLVQLPPPRGIAHHAVLAEILRELRAIRLALTDEGRAGGRAADATLRAPPAGGLSSTP